jgi:hypothetical protein
VLALEDSRCSVSILPTVLSRNSIFVILSLWLQLLMCAEVTFEAQVVRF